MILILTILAVLAPMPAASQVSDQINKTSVYSDQVLRQLVRASRLAVERQQSMMSRSALKEHETTGIRRSSTLSGQDLARFERLSAFAGARLRSLEEASEFKAQEVARMQAEYVEDGPRTEDNDVARQADKNSTMPSDQMQLILRASDAKDWAARLRSSASGTRRFSELLNRRSIPSPQQKRVFDRLSF